MTGDDLQALQKLALASRKHIVTETQIPCQCRTIELTFRWDRLVNYHTGTQCTDGATLAAFPCGQEESDYLSWVCLRLLVRAAEIFSQAFWFSLCPGSSQPSWLQHSSNTDRHFSSAHTHRRPSFLPHGTQVNEEGALVDTAWISAHSQWTGLVLVSVKQVRFEVRACHFEARAPFTTEGAIQVVRVRHGQHTLCERDALKCWVFYDISLIGQDIEGAGH